MKIAENTTVQLDYILKSHDGTLLETTHGQEPITILFGHNMFPGPVEAALEGKSGGDTVNVEIEAKDGFGEVVTENIARRPLKDFMEPENLKVGADIIARNAGQEIKLKVTAIEDGMVTLDANHPFAGMDLIFELKVLNVRKTTESDIAYFYRNGSSDPGQNTGCGSDCTSDCSSCGSGCEGCGG